MLIYRNIRYIFFFNDFFSFIGLSDDTPLTDLGKVASFDMSKLPDLHKSGEDIIREINAELLTKFSSAEVGIIPEDEAQRGMVGVSIRHIFFLSFLKIFYC